MDNYFRLEIFAYFGVDFAKDTDEDVVLVTAGRGTDEEAGEWRHKVILG